MWVSNCYNERSEYKIGEGNSEAMNLLDFYKEHVLTDPEVGDEEIKKVLEISNKFNTKTGLDFMYHAFQSFSDLQN